MSSRKQKARAAAIRRIQSQQQRSAFYDHVQDRHAEPGDFLATLPKDKRDKYMDVAALLLEQPAMAEQIAAMPVSAVAGIVVALAYPDMVGNPPEQQRLDAAAQLRIWNTMQHLSGIDDTPFDSWPISMIEMTDEQIIAQINTDRDAGRIPRPPQE